MKTLSLLCLLFTSSLFAQYSNISLLDQLRLEIEERDATGTVLLAGNTADVSQLDGRDKVDFLQRAIVSLAMERYAAYAGDPYVRKEFGPGTLLDLSHHSFPLGHLNYNAFSGRVEYRRGDDWIEFRPDFFPRVALDDGSGRTRTMVHGLLPEFPAHYSTLVFKGEKVSGAIHRKIFTYENKSYDAGPVTTRFAAKDFLYVLVDGKWMQVSFKAKALAKYLGSPNELLGFIKSDKLDPENLEDLRRILAYADRL